MPAPSDNVDNPYAAPKARVRQPRRRDGMSPLASRGSRLAAIIADSLLGAVIAIPIVILFPIAITDAGEFDFSDGVPMGAMVLFGAVAAMIVLQFFLLWTRSQTIGKIVMRIRIEEHNSDKRAGPVKTILIRGFLVGLISSIPLVGALFAIVNILFIFGKDKRCIHDLMAGTVVREAR